MLFKKRDRPEEDVEVEEVVMDFYPVVRLKPNPSRGFMKTDITPPQDLLYDLFFGETDEIRKKAEEKLREWFVEEGYGGGVWKVEIYTPESKVPLKTKTIKITDEPVKYGIDRWVVYVKSPKSGKFYKAEGVEYDHYPTADELIEDLGGGGVIKLVGYMGNKKMVEYRMKIDAPEPQWVFERDDSFHSQLVKTLEERKKKALEEVLTDVRGDKFEKLRKEMESIKEMLMEKTIEDLRSMLEDMKSKDKNKGEEDKKNFFDLMFTEPYKIKLDLSKKLVEGYIEKGDLETAKKLLMEAIPDGASAFISLITGIGNLANMGALYLQRKMEKEVKTGGVVERKTEGESGRLVKHESDSEDVLFKESDVDVKVEDTEEGWVIKLEGENA
jgi:hypothetical protein